MSQCRVIIKRGNQVVGETVINSSVPLNEEAARVAVYAVCMDAKCQSFLSGIGFNANAAIFTTVDIHATYSFATTEGDQALIEFIQK